MNKLTFLFLHNQYYPNKGYPPPFLTPQSKQAVSSKKNKCVFVDAKRENYRYISSTKGFKDSQKETRKSNGEQRGKANRKL